MHAAGTAIYLSISLPDRSLALGLDGTPGHLPAVSASRDTCTCTVMSHDTSYSVPAPVRYPLSPHPTLFHTTTPTVKSQVSRARTKSKCFSSATCTRHAANSSSGPEDVLLGRARPLGIAVHADSFTYTPPSTIRKGVKVLRPPGDPPSLDADAEEMR